MYLSRLILNHRSRQVQKELAEPYQMHRTLLKCFLHAGNPDERVLFRVDVDQRAGIPTVLVQSHYEPNFSPLQGIGREPYLLDYANENPAVKVFEPKLYHGQVLAFRLLANPTVRRNGKRRALPTPEEQAAWLGRKAEEAGFQVLQARIEKRPTIQGPIFRSEQRHDLLIAAVLFEGLLQVNVVETFQKALEKGVGSAKGLGCGLLSIAPIS